MASKALRLKILEKAPPPSLTRQGLQLPLAELGFGRDQTADKTCHAFCDRERRNQNLDSPALGLVDGLPPPDTLGLARGWSPGQRLVLDLISSTGARGTDVHVMSGTFMRPEAAHAMTLQPTFTGFPPSPGAGTRPLKITSTSWSCDPPSTD